jgi:hypothetical protein
MHDNFYIVLFFSLVELPVPYGKKNWEEDHVKGEGGNGMMEEEMVEIRAVCWQRLCSAGGCRKWLISERCVGRDGAALVAAGYG